MAMIEAFLIILCAVCVFAVLAKRLHVAYPIFFVLGGMTMALIPNFPKFSIPPEWMLLLFLPILLTEAAFFTSLRDFKASIRSILQLAIGLVIFTTVIIAYFSAWLIPTLPLAAAFVLGAIISPPDAVAATSVLDKDKIPKKVVTILQGESLVNDATGLVLYQFAVAAVVTGGFSWMDVSLRFVWMVISGVGIGLFCGWLYMRVFVWIQEQSVEILSTFLAPFAVYILAENLHSSGVLAVVTYGLVVGWKSALVFTSSFRLPAVAMWRMTSFILNGLVFVLIGLQFPDLLTHLSDIPQNTLIYYGAAVSLVAILGRFLYVFAAAYGVRFLFPHIRRKDPYPAWQNVFIVGWTGMRGVVSLATALALPLTLADGSAFPERDLIIFLACAVIISTLILQGIPLPWIIRTLSLNYEMHSLYEQWDARKQAAESALDQLKELAKDESVQSAALDRIVNHYQERITSLGDGPNTPLNQHAPPSLETHPIVQTEHKIWAKVLEAERDAVVCLRQTFKISDDVMHDLLHDIDLLYTRYAASEQGGH